MSIMSWILRCGNSNALCKFKLILHQQCSCHQLQFGDVSELHNLASYSGFPMLNPSSSESIDEPRSALLNQECNEIKVIINCH